MRIAMTVPRLFAVGALCHQSAAMDRLGVKEREMAGKTASFCYYDGDIGFMDEQRPVHDRAYDETAWERMLGFWRQHVR
jgi:dienelactone hydrolase